MLDQAQRLRQLAHQWERRRTRRTIAITSGKGGVGKTNIAVNLAWHCMERGHTVTLLDADLGLANGCAWALRRRIHWGRWYNANVAWRILSTLPTASR